MSNLPFRLVECEGNYKLIKFRKVHLSIFFKYFHKKFVNLYGYLKKVKAK